MNRVQQRVGGRARPLKKQSNGVIALGACILIGLIAVAGAVVYTTKASQAAGAEKKSQEATAAKAAIQGQQEHAKLVKTAVDQIAFHFTAVSGATVKISNLWQDWLTKGGDVDRAVDRALESLKADGTTARVKESADLVRDAVQRAMKSDNRDPELHAKLTTLSGQFQELVNAAVNPSGSFNTYSESLGRMTGDINRTGAELRTLLTARGL